MIIFLLSTAFALKVNANIAFEVEGKIKISNLTNDKANFLLVTDSGKFNLHNVNSTDLNCVKGIFTIASNYAPQNTYSLLEVVKCQSDVMAISNVKKANLDNKNINICPEIYSPVCAQPIMPHCAEGMTCIQLMPNPKTYGNRCEMKRDNANFLFNGECREITLFNNLSVYPSLSRGLKI